MIKKLLGFYLLGIVLISCGQKKNNSDYLIKIETRFGTMYAVLYDDTPLHKTNFLKLANEGFFDSTTFHRVIQEFMIQGGDPNSKDDNPNNDGTGGPGYTQEAEITPQFFHKKGALSAARLGDRQNPEKRSSGSQFYIVQGKTYSIEAIDKMELKQNYSLKNKAFDTFLTNNQMVKKQLQEFRTSQNREGFDSLITAITPQVDSIAQHDQFSYSPLQKETYQKLGGTPHLDGQYTVFGEVVKGLDIIDTIANQQVQPGNNRPLENIYMKISVEELKKKKITKLTGYEYLK